ncbi:hypothetical protein [Levilactobacillus mulengensis]|uniref:hypothetical protein n=1 Tax=Levilactobacillus mulengensis TaxID=2486025 RepID=UPI000F7A6E6D|nr:hypothetical protein [Levilactobacillus mulengensis]
MHLRHQYHHSLVLISLLAGVFLLSKLMILQFALPNTFTTTVVMIFDFVLLVGVYLVDRLRRQVSLTKRDRLLYGGILVWIILASVTF